MRVMLRFINCPRNFKEANATATLADYCCQQGH